MSQDVFKGRYLNFARNSEIVRGVSIKTLDRLSPSVEFVDKGRQTIFCWIFVNGKG